MEQHCVSVGTFLWSTSSHSVFLCVTWNDLIWHTVCQIWITPTQLGLQPPSFLAGSVCGLAPPSTSSLPFYAGYSTRSCILYLFIPTAQPLFFQPSRLLVLRYNCSYMCLLQPRPPSPLHPPHHQTTHLQLLLSFTPNAWTESLHKH